MNAADRRAFWLLKKGWPAIDWPGTVFLGRAICQLGEARHGREWTGHEAVAWVPLKIGPHRGGLATAHSRPLPRRSINAIDSSPPRPLPRPETPEEYRARFEANARDIEEKTSAVARWADVHRTMWTWLIEGRVGFAVRSSGGQMLPGDAMAWNAAGAGDYLADCHLPFTGGGWATTFLPVFVSAGDLAACLKPSALAGSATVADQTRAKKAMVELFNSNRTERTMTNPDLKKWVEAKIGREISDRGFDAAKSSAIEETGATIWRRGGRPKH